LGLLLTTGLMPPGPLGRAFRKKNEWITISQKARQFTKGQPIVKRHCINIYLQVEIEMYTESKQRLNQK